MATSETLRLGASVLRKYKTCKQEFNFGRGTDEVFVDFLLEISVKTVDMMKHLNPVLGPVITSEDSLSAGPTSLPRCSQVRPVEPHGHSSSRHLAEAMNCRPAIHRPLFIPPSSSSSFSSPSACPYVQPPPRSAAARKFVRKLPNFVKPTVSRDHKITEKNFVEFKCNPQISGSNPEVNPKPLQDQITPKTPTVQDQIPATSSNNKPDSSSPSSSTAKTIEHLNAEISQFEKEIGNVLESLTQTSSEHRDADVAIKRLSEGNRSLSMIGMRKYGEDEKEDEKKVEEKDGRKIRGRRGKVSYTRLNSRYKKYPDEMLKQAMQSVQMGYKTVAQAAKEYNIPRQTLQYRLFKRKKKFHVFAPNIPYTNNFFIENYNNTTSSYNETDINKVLRNIKVESSDSDYQGSKSDDVISSADVITDSQTMDSTSGTLDETDILLSLERTVQELLGSSENIDFTDPSLNSDNMIGESSSSNLGSTVTPGSHSSDSAVKGSHVPSDDMASPQTNVRAVLSNIKREIESETICHSETEAVNIRKIH